MKLARCGYQGVVWWGEVDGGEVHLLTSAQQLPIGRWIPGALERLAARAEVTVGLEDVALLTPVPAPSKVILVGLNYRGHAAESGVDVPERPLVFAKWPSAVVGPGSPIVLPEDSDEVDWEVELAVVIGSPARHVVEEDVLEVIAGYTVSNDVSARDIQVSDGQFVRAKSYDTFCPVGPWIVTVDELGAADDLGIGLSVNGETYQQSRTSDLVFGVEELVSFCSSVATLNPGDLILTGTPHGTGYGLDPQRYLRPGDHVVSWVEGIGELHNPVVAR